jgi:hypothetical protein
VDLVGLAVPEDLVFQLRCLPLDLVGLEDLEVLENLLGLAGLELLYPAALVVLVFRQLPVVLAVLVFLFLVVL